MDWSQTHTQVNSPKCHGKFGINNCGSVVEVQENYRIGTAQCATSAE